MDRDHKPTITKTNRSHVFVVTTHFVFTTPMFGLVTSCYYLQLMIDNFLLLRENEVVTVVWPRLFSHSPKVAWEDYVCKMYVIFHRLFSTNGAVLSFLLLIDLVRSKWETDYLAVFYRHFHKMNNYLRK